MEENKVGVAMLLSGIATVIFWMISTSFSTHTGMMNFLFQTYGWTMVIFAVCVLLMVLLLLRNNKDNKENKVGVVVGIIIVIGLLFAAYLFFGKVDNHVYVHEAATYLGGLI